MTTCKKKHIVIGKLMTMCCIWIIVIVGRIPLPAEIYSALRQKCDITVYGRRSIP